MAYVERRHVAAPKNCLTFTPVCDSWDRTTVVADGVALVCAGLDVLLSADLSSSTSLAVADVLELLEVQRWRLDAVDARVVAEVDQRTVAGEFGQTSTADLVSDYGVAQGAHGELIGMPAVRTLLDEAELGLVVQAGSGQVLSYGRTRRLASPAQRRALAARDGGCCFPGCDRPAAWSQAHHIVAWLHGGDTDIDNLCLVCAHRQGAERRRACSIA